MAPGRIASMRILITGAGGFVGAALVRQALRAGHTVTATVRPGGNTERLAQFADAVQIVAVDLGDGAAVATKLRELRPEVIVHVAWHGVGARDRLTRKEMAANIDAACALLEAGIATGISKFVGVGSQAEYGPLGRRISEADLPEPTSLYGAAKLATLHLTRQIAGQAGVAFAWMRLFATYGPDDNPNWLIPSLIEQMLDRRRPQLTQGTQLWDYLYIDDVARAILAVATTPTATGVFNLGSDQPVAIRAVVEQIRDLVAADLPLVFGEIAFRPDQVWHMQADVTRLRAATGWAPQTTIGEGLARTVAWHHGRRGPTTATTVPTPPADRRRDDA